MYKIAVTTTAQILPFGDPARVLLQNLGPGIVYFGPSSSVSANNGFKLLSGMGYEFPETLRQMSQWDEVWVVSNSTADLRVADVG